MDKIFLKNLRLLTRIGLFEWEKQIEQIIRIDLEVGFDISKAAETDNVDYSLDYKSLSNSIKDYVSDHKHELIETLIENIANLVLVKFKVEYITISISKPGAIRDSEDVGITITRSKKSPT